MHKIDRTGETETNNQGLKMTIVAYKSARDIDVRFEDGLVIPNKTYCAFRRREIRHPGVGKNRISGQKYVGKTKLNKQGLKITIVAYNTYNDIRVQFEDGSVVTARYDQFKSGKLMHPNTSRNYIKLNQFRKTWVGETNYNLKGYKMQIIEYADANNITVKFERDPELVHTSLDAFRTGRVNRHQDQVLSLKSHIGDVGLANCGIGMKIIDAAVGTITILFDTGCIRENLNYRAFRLGQIGHPFPYQIGVISMDGPAYRFGDTGNFYCHCPKCGLVDIMSIQEMEEHICQKQ